MRIEVTVMGRMGRLLGLVVLLGWFMPAVAGAEDADAAVQAILDRDEPPAGVVFEIAVRDADALRWAVPKVRGYVNQLRRRHPGLDIAVVTHGREQFALQTDKRSDYGQVQAQVRSLVQDAGVPVHVCETNAARRDVHPEDFPDFITVAAAGPAQVNDYVSLGYVRIRLRNP
jgi:intracellular sulfur oxidation DsrE/DsrF family protein